MPSAGRIVQQSRLLQPIDRRDGEPPAFGAIVAESAQSVHSAYSSGLTGSGLRTIECEARERPPVKGLGRVPQMEPKMIKSESFEYRGRYGPGRGHWPRRPRALPQSHAGSSAWRWRRQCHVRAVAAVVASRWRRWRLARWRRRLARRWRRLARGGGGFIPGAVAGAVIGGAIASAPYGYYGGPGYYAPGYYDDQYYDDAPRLRWRPAATMRWPTACRPTVPTIRRSGTYLGYDG